MSFRKISATGDWRISVTGSQASRLHRKRHQQHGAPANGHAIPTMCANRTHAAGDIRRRVGDIKSPPRPVESAMTPVT